MGQDVLKGGAGAYPPGNPFADPHWGGGAGCHISALPYGCNDPSKCTYDVDQINRAPNNLVGDATCQCNYLFNDNWEHWVLTMGGLGDEWVKGTLPEAAMCWVNNLKDMINLQNYLWMHKSTWFYEGGGAPSGYWGWNEIPIGRRQIIDSRNWDAVVIKMPLYICGGSGGGDSFDCLNWKARAALEKDLSQWVSSRKLVPGSGHLGKHPGADVVLMREWIDNDGRSNSWFFCQSWVSPNKHWVINYNSASASHPNGACWLDRGSAFTSSLLNQSFKPDISRSAAKAYIRSFAKPIIV